MLDASIVAIWGTCDSGYIRWFRQSTAAAIWG